MDTLLRCPKGLNYTTTPLLLPLLKETLLFLLNAIEVKQALTIGSKALHTETGEERPVARSH